MESPILSLQLDSMTDVEGLLRSDGTSALRDSNVPIPTNAPLPFAQSHSLSKTLGALPGTSKTNRDPEWVFFVVILAFVVLFWITWRLILKYSPDMKWGKEKDSSEEMSSNQIQKPEATLLQRSSRPLPLKKRIALHNYNPQLPDEIQIRIGDVVIVDYLCDDGWAVGWNTTINQKGAFPFGCLSY
jgi:hypothetical protein